MKKRIIIILIIAAIVFIALVCYRFYVFTLEVNGSTYFVGSLNSKIAVSKQTGKKTIDIKFINSKYHVDISTPYDKVDKAQIYFQKPYSLDRQFFFMVGDSGATFSPVDNSLSMKLEFLSKTKIKVSMEGVIYNDSNHNDSLKVFLKARLTE